MDEIESLLKKINRYELISTIIKNINSNIFVTETGEGLIKDKEDTEENKKEILATLKKAENEKIIKDVITKNIKSAVESQKKLDKTLWYNHQNKRACFWLFCRLSYKYNTIEEYSLEFNECFERTQEIIHNQKLSLREIEQYRQEFINHKNKFSWSWLENHKTETKKYDWLYSNLTKRIDKNPIKPPYDAHPKIINELYYKEYSTFIFDSINKNEDGFILINNKIRSAWNQKNKRENDKRNNIKQCNFSLDKITREKLDELSESLELTKNKIISNLIDAYHKDILKE